MGKGEIAGAIPPFSSVFKRLDENGRKLLLEKEKWLVTHAENL